MLENITLEMSLKPFKKTDKQYIKNVIESIFDDWYMLIKDANVISILLWTADGSEILDWHGDIDEEISWCKYVGGANNLEKKSKWDPEGIGLHSRAYYYMDNPPTITYAILKKIIMLIKEIGKRRFPDKKIRVGETFDPGPEFAVSKFKYVNHNEICSGATMGAKSMVCCYSTLHSDNVKYAAFPNGIEEGTPFATFFGRQAQSLLYEMGFDYLWLSNGFGFGLESWSTTGAIFSGTDFDVTRFDEVKEKILTFWRLFRCECSYPVETRGTNLTAGIDLSTDGVPLRDIYEGNFDILPPPNSPWAALNGNFGIEIAGYLSRISHLPAKEYLYRFYVHDPWWANTPWTQRYDSLPHDIYLPLSLCRLDSTGVPMLPTHLNILSIDNSYGEMPDFCAYEPSVHILKAKRYAPDMPSPVIWVYPFDEYHKNSDKLSIQKAFSEDWYISEAINHALPIGSVISTKNFISAIKNDSTVFDGCIMISTAPESGSDYESEILKFISSGGKVIFYGNPEMASEKFLQLMGIKITENTIYGELENNVLYETDTVKNGKLQNKIYYRPLICGGDLKTVHNDRSSAKPFVYTGEYVSGTYTENAVWLRGICSADYINGHLLTPDDENIYYSGESLMRKALDMLGIKIRLKKELPSSCEPCITISRHDNAFMFAVCAKDTTTVAKIKMPLGAPIPIGRETALSADGFGEYHFSKAEFWECRIFVEQAGGVISCHDMSVGSFFRERKIKLLGLENATVRFYAPKRCDKNIEAVYNSDDVHAVISESFDGKYISDKNGTYFEAKNITGNMIFSVPLEKLHGSLERVEGNIPPIVMQ